MFGITTGHIGRLFGLNVDFVSISPTVIVFLGINWRRKGSLSRKGSIPATSTCSGMGQPEPAVLENPASRCSAMTRSVSSVRSLGDRSTWLAQIRIPGSDSDREFTHPQYHRSERRVVRCFEPFSDRVLGLMITSRPRSRRLGKRCC